MRERTPPPPLSNGPIPSPSASSRSLKNVPGPPARGCGGGGGGGEGRGPLRTNGYMHPPPPNSPNQETNPPLLAISYVPIPSPGCGPWVPVVPRPGRSAPSRGVYYASRRAPSQRMSLSCAGTRALWGGGEEQAPQISCQRNLWAAWGHLGSLGVASGATEAVVPVRAKGGCPGGRGRRGRWRGGCNRSGRTRTACPSRSGTAPRRSPGTGALRGAFPGKGLLDGQVPIRKKGGGQPPPPEGR